MQQVQLKVQKVQQQVQQKVQQVQQHPSAAVQQKAKVWAPHVPDEPLEEDAERLLQAVTAVEAFFCVTAVFKTSVEKKFWLHQVTSFSSKCKLVFCFLFFSFQ